MFNVSVKHLMDFIKFIQKNDIFQKSIGKTLDSKLQLQLKNANVFNQSVKHSINLTNLSQK